MTKIGIDLAGTANACPFCDMYHSMAGVTTKEDCDRMSGQNQLVPFEAKHMNAPSEAELKALAGMFTRPCG